jgi:transcriptional regulator with XRE-family HTH domain
MNTVALFPQAKYNDEICTAIKSAMAKRGWTYEKLATVLGKNLHTVWNWLNGRAPLPAEVLPVFARLEINEPLRIIAKACNHEFKPSPGYLRNYHPPTKLIEDFQLDCYRALAQFHKTIDDGKKDGRFSRAEQESIKDTADKAIIEILETVAKIVGGGQ